MLPAMARLVRWFTDNELLDKVISKAILNYQRVALNKILQKPGRNWSMVVVYLWNSETIDT